MLVAHSCVCCSSDPHLSPWLGDSCEAELFSSVREDDEGAESEEDEEDEEEDEGENEGEDEEETEEERQRQEFERQESERKRLEQQKRRRQERERRQQEQLERQERQQERQAAAMAKHMAKRTMVKNTPSSPQPARKSAALVPQPVPNAGAIHLQKRERER